MSAAIPTGSELIAARILVDAQRCQEYKRKLREERKNPRRNQKMLAWYDRSLMTYEDSIVRWAKFICPPLTEEERELHRVAEAS